MKVVVVKIDIADETLTIEQLHKLIGEAVEKGAKRIEVPEERKGIPYEVSFVRDATDEEESKNVFKTLTPEQVEALKKLYDIEIDINGLRTK
jgi:hypothetical protein